MILITTLFPARLARLHRQRAVPNVPNLLQYVIAGTYYARCKVDGKPVRASLETGVFSAAKVRLPDKLKELRKPKAVVGTFTDGHVQFEQQTKCDHTLAELSKVYRLRCIECLLRSWPELDAKKVDTVTEPECRQWAQLLRREVYSAIFQFKEQCQAVCFLCRQELHPFKPGTLP
jgi:hypothetical protein